MLNTSEKVVAITAQLYDMRRLVRSVIGDDKFRAKVEDFRQLFAVVERENRCSTLQAMLLILKTCDGDAVRIAQVCAIAVELMEPSLPPPSSTPVAEVSA